LFLNVTKIDIIIVNYLIYLSTLPRAFSAARSARRMILMPRSLVWFLRPFSTADTWGHEHRQTFAMYFCVPDGMLLIRSSLRVRGICCLIGLLFITIIIFIPYISLVIVVFMLVAKVRRRIAAAIAILLTKCYFGSVKRISCFRTI